MAKDKSPEAGAARGASPAEKPAKDDAGKGSAGHGDAPVKQRSAKSWRTVGQFSEDEGLGETKVYEELKAGRLKAVKVGRSTRIFDEASDAWKAALPAYTPGGDAFNKRGRIAA